MLALQRNLASNPESFFRQLQSNGPRGDLSLMAASLSGLTGLSGLAAGLGLPMPQFGFPPDGLSKPEHRFMQKRVQVHDDDEPDDDDDGGPDEKSLENYSGEIFGAKRRRPNEEFNEDPEAALPLQDTTAISRQKAQSK